MACSPNPWGSVAYHNWPLNEKKKKEPHVNIPHELYADVIWERRQLRGIDGGVPNLGVLRTKRSPGLHISWPVLI